jgi:hypothetical protein
MSDIRMDRKLLEFPQCPTCHASLVDSLNHMVTPTHCDLCWHLSLRDSFLRFIGYIGLAMLLYNQLLRLFPWLFGQ